MSVLTSIAHPCLHLKVSSVPFIQTSIYDPCNGKAKQINLVIETQPLFELLESSHLRPTVNSITTPIHTFSNASVKSVNGYQNLPCKLLVKIFTYFTEEELSSTLAPVCRNWRLATQDPSLWRQLMFRGNKTPVDVMCRMLRNAPRLQELTLIDVPAERAVAVIRQLCRCNSWVVNVSLRHCTNAKKRNERIQDTVLRNLIRSCKYIRHLDLEGTQFYASRFIQDLPVMPNLTSLNLGSNACLTVRDLISLSLNCRGLEELKIPQRPRRSGQLMLTDDYAVFLFHNIQKSLISLEFDVLGLGEPTYKAILKCSSIQNLGLNNAFYFSGELFRSLAISLPEIRSLKLNSASQLTSDDFCHLFKNHQEVMKNLTTLSLVRCWKLDDTALRTIADMCNKSLEYLSVRNCKLLHSVGIDYVIQQCHGLRHLDVAHVPQLNIHSMHNTIVLNASLQVLVVDDDRRLDVTLHRLKSSKLNLTVIRSLSAYRNDEIVFI